MNVQVRTCGEGGKKCTACCKVYCIEEAEKELGKWCQHCTIGQGCKIYAKRPDECATYKCIWLHGYGEESDRPDLLKVVMDGKSVAVGNRKITLITIWEVSPGATDKKRVLDIKEAYKKQGYVICFRRLSSTGKYREEYVMPLGLLNDKEKKLFLEELEKDARPLQ